MLAYFVNNGFPWREVTLLKEVFQNVLNEVQERADDITKCELVTQPVLVSQPMRDGVLKSVCDEEQRIKHIEEIEQKCIQERNEVQQAVQQLEQQFLEFDSSPENLSAENLATIVAIMLLLKRLL
ncbi:uncharacterized protein [Pocillopora verrucosa]|uniref:uncharacterized protein isoform X2 n=1 Tax=Pocillopora verrucosa TaxID=203993 RepID=UPI0033415705